MGRLAGFSYREVTRKLRTLGFEFYRTGKAMQRVGRVSRLEATQPRSGQSLRRRRWCEAPFKKGDHEIWINSTTNLRTTIPHHREVREGTLRNILKQAGVEVEDFLKA